jgi:hypothetical protein
VENIFEELKNRGKKKVYFIFSDNTSKSISQGYLCFLYAESNFPEKTSVYEGNGFNAILVELE